MPMADGEGGLSVTMNPGIAASTGEPMFNLTLSAQCSPRGSDLDSAMSMLDQGREWVVRGFADLTTDSMHQHWGRLDRVDD